MVKQGRFKNHLVISIVVIWIESNLLFENKQNEDHFLPMHTALNFYFIYEKDDIMNIKFFWNCTVNQKS